MNRKMIFAALFCGFVLNNGYCFSEWHKLTNEYLNDACCNLKETVDALNESYKFIRNSRIKNEWYKSILLMSISKMVSDANSQISRGFEKFVKEFLGSVITRGKYRCRTVGSLLVRHQLDEDTLRTICSNLVKFWVNDTCDGVFLELNCGLAICVRDAKKELRAELIYLNDKSQYTAEFGIK